MTSHVIATAVAVVLAAGPASAQQPTTVQPVETSQRQLVTTRVETRVTTGKPYSAEAVTETTQTLADGNRIERSTTVRIYRDGQGRTRREQLTGTTVRSVTISDPIGQASYTLDPEKKTARRSGVALLATTAPTGYVASGSGGSVRIIAAPQAPVVVGGANRSDAGNATKEDLGQQQIEGVSARGTRTTTVIPAGSIGNVNDIKIVSEQWFSDDLQVLVMTKHSDPRSGETIYRLRHIVRAEPDASLFVVPPDYTVVTGGGGRERGGQ